MDRSYEFFLVLTLRLANPFAFVARLGAVGHHAELANLKSNSEDGPTWHGF
jgi:hypothetical protein